MSSKQRGGSRRSGGASVHSRRRAGARGRCDVVHVQESTEPFVVDVRLQSFGGLLEQGSALDEGGNELSAYHVAAARLGGLLDPGDGGERGGESVAS